MAVKAITPTVLAGLNKVNVDALTFEAANDAGDGFTVDVGKYADQKVLLLFKNTNSGGTARTYTIQKGNALQGVANLESGSIASTKIAAIVLESGKYMNVSGDLKGKLHIVVSDVELQMACIVLPTS